MADEADLVWQSEFVSPVWRVRSGRSPREPSAAQRAGQLLRTQSWGEYMDELEDQQLLMRRRLRRLTTVIVILTVAAVLIGYGQYH